MTAAMNVYPTFVFDRRHDIELETGVVFAGTLVIDLPNKKPKQSDIQLIEEIIQHVLEAARSGQVPINGMMFGWDGGRKPINAVDTDDDTLMAAWAKDRLHIVVRINPRNDGLLYVDSEIQTAGWASKAPEKKQ
jgi:hypothetical protein